MTQEAIRGWLKLLVLGSALVWALGCDVFVTAETKAEETNPICTNQAWDSGMGEADTDCGGPCVNKCVTGKHCNTPTDCQSNKCVNQMCWDGPAHCSNNQNDPAGGETGIDCGGTECTPCGAGQPCQLNTDCMSSQCNTSTMTCNASTTTPSHCSNGGLDAQLGESDKDCGGSDCPGCIESKHCNATTDCASGLFCDSTSTCRSLPAHCKNNMKDAQYGETDTDCGGPYCNRCEVNAACVRPSDCGSTFGCFNGVCQSSGGPCYNGALDYFESDTDCGGHECKSCSVGKACTFSSDCQHNLYCAAGTCASSPATCFNGTKDSGEGDVDCGGQCQPCLALQGCSFQTDCMPSMLCASACAKRFIPPGGYTPLALNGPPMAAGEIRDISMALKPGTAIPWLAVSGENKNPQVYAYDELTTSWTLDQDLTAHSPFTSSVWGIWQTEFFNFNGSYLLTTGSMDLGGVEGFGMYLWEYVATSFTPKLFGMTSYVNMGQWGALAPDLGAGTPKGVVTFEIEYYATELSDCSHLRFRDWSALGAFSYSESYGQYNASWRNDLAPMAFLPYYPGVFLTARVRENLSTQTYPTGNENSLAVYFLNSGGSFAPCGNLATSKEISALAVAHTKSIFAVAYRDILTGKYGVSLYGMPSFSCNQTALNSYEGGKISMSLNSAEAIFDLAFSSDDSILYAVVGTGSSNRVEAWRADHGGRLVYLGGLSVPGVNPFSVASSPTDQWVGAGATDQVILWKLY